MNINVSLAIDNGEIHGRYHYCIDKLEDVTKLFDVITNDINRVTNYKGEIKGHTTIQREYNA